MLPMKTDIKQSRDAVVCECPFVADIVAKRFFASRRATLIQEMDPSRKIDSNDVLVGFESCSLGGGRRLLQQYWHVSEVPVGAFGGRSRRKTGL
jgi:hypothetical protein